MKADARKCVLFFTVHYLLKPALSGEMPHVEHNLTETGSILQETSSMPVGKSPEGKTRPLGSFDAFGRGPTLTGDKLDIKQPASPTESIDATIARLIEDISLKEKVRGRIKNEVYHKILLQTLLYHKTAHHQFVNTSNSSSGLNDTILQDWLQHVTGTDVAHRVLQDLTDGGRDPLTFDLQLGQGLSSPLSSSSSSSSSPYINADRNGTSGERVRRNDNGMMYIPVGGTKKVKCPTAADAAGSSLIQMAFLSICLTVFSIVVNVNNNINNNNNNNNINTDNNLANNNAQLSLNVNNAAQINVMLPPPGRKKRESPSFRDVWKRLELEEAVESLEEILEKLAKEREEKTFTKEQENSPFLDRSKDQGSDTMNFTHRASRPTMNPSGNHRSGAMHITKPNVNLYNHGFGTINSTQRGSRPTGKTSEKTISLMKDFTETPLSPIRTDTGNPSRPIWSYAMGGSNKNYTVSISRPTENNSEHLFRREDFQSTVVIGNKTLIKKNSSLENNISEKTNNTKAITPKKNIESLPRTLSNFPGDRIYQEKVKKKIALDRVAKNVHNKTIGQRESDAEDDMKLLKSVTTPEIAERVVKEMKLWLRGLNSSRPSCLWFNLCQALQERATWSWVTLLASFVAHHRESKRLGREAVTIEDFIRMAFTKQQCGLLFPLCSPSSEI
ncbi:uncharacterized protein [Palaemon carinicauda]|uniref:uncharacterized protein n=1 Tax=Palaemon carinicauda TaxID=392227 RepID=UPI0035B5C265